MTPKEKFIDEVLDSIYLNGTKNDDGHYVLTLTQATQVANEIFELKVQEQ